VKEKKGISLEKVMKYSHSRISTVLPEKYYLCEVQPYFSVKDKIVMVL